MAAARKVALLAILFFILGAFIAVLPEYTYVPTIIYMTGGFLLLSSFTLIPISVILWIYYRIKGKSLNINDGIKQIGKHGGVEVRFIGGSQINPDKFVYALLLPMLLVGISITIIGLIGHSSIIMLGGIFLVGGIAIFILICRSLYYYSRIEALVSNISITENGVKLPEGTVAYEQEFLSTGWESKGYHASTKIRDIGNSPVPKNDINSNDTTWSAIIDEYGYGWFKSTAFMITEGYYKNVIILPIAPSSFSTQVHVSGAYNMDSASAEVEVKEGIINGKVHSVHRQEVKSFYILLRGKTGNLEKKVELIRFESENNFTTHVQPSKPFILIFYKQFFSPLNIKNILGLTMLIGDFKRGSFDIALGVDIPLKKDILFWSEPLFKE